MTTNATFDIPITTDDLLEGNEMFYVTIDTSSLPNNVIVGDVDIATILILDDDRKYTYWLYSSAYIAGLYVNINFTRGRSRGLKRFHGTPPPPFLGEPLYYLMSC